MPRLCELIRAPEAHRGAVEVEGWIRTVRESKNAGFIELSDGSSFKTVQVVFDPDGISNELAKSLATGAAIRVAGEVVLTPEMQQPFEIKAAQIELLGACAEDYPLQKKRHTLEYMRTIGHLRPRANIFQATFRVRSVVAQAIHRFFDERGFLYVHTPLITPSDCEGAGEMFRVTTLDLADVPKTDSGAPDLSKDFFGSEANLTVSGQLEAETLATALSRVYTFGPTFRAENSNTPRHLSEFWMCEPEMAFFDLFDDMDLEEEFLKYMLNWALTKCGEDMKFFEQRIQPGVIAQIQHVVDTPFKRITYTDAVKELEPFNSKFEFPIEWGKELQTEHERYLTEQIFKSPVMVYNYPKDVKAFYMKQNDDGKTVRAVDVLVPGLGEITGGSEREENYDKLLKVCEERHMDMTNYQWYLDLRRFGSVPHSGFGLGFARLLRYITGMANIRDVIPFPRAPKLADF